jgi:hypothetical protein
MNFRARLARMVVGLPPPAVERRSPTIPLPPTNPLAGDEARDALRNAALSLTDHDVHAYLLVTVRQSEVNGRQGAAVDVCGDGLLPYWSAVAETLERVLIAGGE